MIPTPDTSHVPYSRVYEPAEDSFFFVDTLSSSSEIEFLHQRFATSSTAPLVVEVGPGSGVVLAAVTAHADVLFGTSHVLTAGVDVNEYACAATNATVRRALRDRQSEHGGKTEKHGAEAFFFGTAQGSLLTPFRPGTVDVLIFNPPYVPTEELPAASLEARKDDALLTSTERFERDSHLLALSYAGGKDGMEVTDRLTAAVPEALSSRGCAYVLLCHGNKPHEVKRRIQRDFGAGWQVMTVGHSGHKAGREKLQIIRIWRA